MTALLWLLPALPLGAGAMLAVTRPRGAAAIGAGLAAVTLGLAIAVAVGRPRVSAPFFAGLPAGLAVDGLSAVMVVTVAAVTLTVLVYSAGDLPESRFCGLMLIFAGAMLVTVTATTLVPLLMAWELMGAMSYALIGYHWADADRVGAGGVAFLTTRAADLGLYVAAGAALAGTGSLTLARLPGAPSPWLHWVTAGIVVAALGKSAQLPFSFWLSRAMAGPSPVSALLHSATMVAAGAYLLLRTHPLLTASGWGAGAVGWAGAVTALALGAVAVAQRDLKQLLAASTCAQLGFMVLAAGTGALAGGLGHLVAHAATKSLLFLAAGAFLSALGTQDLAELTGAGRRYRVVGTAFAAGGLTLAGVAPLSLWFTKDAVLSVALERSPALYALGLAAGVLSAVYSGKALGSVLARSSGGAGRVAPVLAGPLAPLALAAVAGGLLVPLSDRVLGAGPAPPAWEAALSALLAVTALAASWRPPWGPVPRTDARRLPAAVPARLPRWPPLQVFRATVSAWVSALQTAARKSAATVSARLPRWSAPWADVRRLPATVPGWALRWLALEAAARLLVVRPTLTLARGLAAFDDRLLDGAVHGTARLGLRLASLTDLRLERSVDGAVRTVAAGARGLGRLARRPQTGQLHQYYVQVLVGLAVLALLLLLAR